MSGKIDKEYKIVDFMIRAYCKRKHSGNDLCIECNDLLNYAKDRLKKCPFGENKSSCLKCTIHCYDQKHRTSIKLVMRYIGPEMVYLMPLGFISHLFMIRKKGRSSL